jgi:hypothetical protein
MITTVALRRLPPMEALVALLSLPRLPGWADSASQAKQFEHLGVLVERLGVYLGRIPWGPPFPEALVATILDAVDQPGPSR